MVVRFIGGGTPSHNLNNQSNKDMMCSVIAQYLTSKEIIILRLLVIIWAYHIHLGFRACPDVGVINLAMLKY